LPSRSARRRLSASRLAALVRERQAVSRGPKREPGLANELAGRHRTEVARVVAIVSIVAQQHVFPGPKHLGAPITGRWVGRDVRFRQCHAVYVDNARSDHHLLARKADDALDQRSPLILRRTKDNYVPPLWRSEAQGKLVHHYVLAIVQRWLHAVPVHARVLQRGANGHKQDHRQQQGLESIARKLGPEAQANLSGALFPLALIEALARCTA